jgi:alpha/beta superfamily hydrolase
MFFHALPRCGQNKYARICSVMDLKGNLFIDGPAGRLEALLKEPAGAITRAAIVCHPHPLFAGTMHNKVVYRIAKAFQDSGFAALRFNFRGTQQSEGTHDYGRGEQDDLRAAMSFIEQKYSNAELWIAGFSFGAAMTLKTACTDPRVRALVFAGLPVSKLGEYELSPANCEKPKLLVQGANDEFGSVADLERFYENLGGEKRLKVIADADHFFTGQLNHLYDAVRAFINEIEYSQEYK